MYLNIRSYCTISNGRFCKDGHVLVEDRISPPEAFVKAIYQQLQPDYPKFFKMDNLSKLGFLASEALLAGSLDRNERHDDFSIILFNRSASLDTDINYQRTISDFPSPSLFVYTLPNIVAGEIAIRNKIYGETACFVTESFSPEALCMSVGSAAASQSLCGWVNYYDGHYEALMLWVVCDDEPRQAFEPLAIRELFRH